MNTLLRTKVSSTNLKMIWVFFAFIPYFIPSHTNILLFIRPSLEALRIQNYNENLDRAKLYLSFPFSPSIDSTGPHPRLKLTYEMENAGHISFLDVWIINQDSKIITDWYQKPTWSERYLNFNSHHPRSYKIGTVYNLVDRGIKLANLCFHDKNLSIIRNELIKNGYPSTFLNKMINSRLKKILACDNNNNTPSLRTVGSHNRYIAIPYVADLYESLNRSFKKYDVQFVVKNVIDLHSVFDSDKDILPKGKQSNCVYKIDCKNCKKPYIGQTGRHLCVRINNHKNNIKEDADRHTALTIHRVDFYHIFDFDKIKILHQEPHCCKRIILEMCNIVKHHDSVNLRQDVKNLSETYIKLYTDSAPR
ncbi:uncharacterized protein LOC124406242 [Diprion similis]|uniref:uncharacterized protein LOC124406242 n=1 Tax=Diprion similis TaxID=362088 RepID=UPI001EF8A275|nr:uncharacterized protein LOC124406242 [Diprion similis]